jgi:O-antigen ligase
MPLVMLLPFLVVLNGLAVPIAGVSVRLDQVAACLLVIPLVASTLIGARRLRVDSTMWWLAAILAANVGASLLHSPVRSYSLMQCANLASAWVIYPLIVNALDTREAVDAFVRRVLWAAILGCGIAVGAFALASAGVDVGGAEVSATAATRLTEAYGAYGVMAEPNLLGSFAAAYLVLAATLLALVPHASPADTRLARWTVAVAGIALVLSFTRAAWLGALVGFALVGVFKWRAVARVARARRIVMPLATAAAVVVLLLVVPGAAGTLFRFKIANLVNLQSQTAVIRGITYALALDQTAVHPWIGWGTFTFAPLTAQGPDFQQFENWKNLWIGNYLLLALHDTGIVGLGLWCGLVWSIVARGVRAVRAVAHGALADVPEAGGRAIALTTAVSCLLIPFLTTSGFSLGYPWLLIGLLGAHCALTTRDRRASGAAAPPPAADAT